MQKSKTDEALLSQVDLELVEGEELLWVGQPDPISLALKPSTLWNAGFGVLWLAIVLFIFRGFAGWSMFGSSGMPGGSLFSLFPLIFIGVGLWQVSAPLRAYLSARRTVYAITNQRAIIVSSLLSRSVQSYGPAQMQFIQTSTNMNGTGNVIFDRETRTRSSRRGGRRTYTVDIGFFGLANFREVEALMLREFTQLGGMQEKPKRGGWLPEPEGW